LLTLSAVHLPLHVSFSSESFNAGNKSFRQPSDFSREYRKFRLAATWQEWIRWRQGQVFRLRRLPGMGRVVIGRKYRLAIRAMKDGVMGGNWSGGMPFRRH